MTDYARPEKANGDGESWLLQSLMYTPALCAGVAFRADFGLLAGVIAAGVTAGLTILLAEGLKWVWRRA